MALTDKLKAIANSIRGKTGGTEELTLDQMATAIEGIETGGTGGMVVCENETPTKDLTLADWDNLRIGFPNAESVEDSAFVKCTLLKSVDFPVAKSVEGYAFQYCDTLESASFPVATSVGEMAFGYCYALKSINIPAATSIGGQVFIDCRTLTSVDLPLATNIGEGAFEKCAALKNINLPLATNIGEGAFGWCTSLTSVDLPAATNIEGGAFMHCTNLSTLILRTTETVCNIIITGLLNTKIATLEGAPTGEGFIYVPTSLYEGYVELITYQAAQLVGDATTAEYIARAVLRKIEDYPEICG